MRTPVFHWLWLLGFAIACQKSEPQGPAHSPPPTPAMVAATPAVAAPAPSASTVPPPTPAVATLSASAEPPPTPVADSEPTQPPPARLAGSETVSKTQAPQAPQVPGDLRPRLLGPAAGGPTTTIALGPGKAKSKMSGCIETPKAEQDKPVTRSARPKLPPPSIAARPGGLVVTHPFEHGCCLKATTNTQVKGAKVDIVEQLTGSPCRCMCHSTIETTVGLKPGSYEVVVTLVSSSGDRQEALRQQVAVGQP